MKRRYKGIQDFLYLIIILFLLVLPAFHECHDLMDFHLLSPIPAFEQARPQDMAANHQNKFQGLESNFSALIPLLALDSFKQVFYQPSQISSLDQQALILRC